jgi:hypothetical protein
MESLIGEKRRDKRKAYNATVDLTVDSLTYTMLLQNLSLSGAFIAGDYLPPIEIDIPVSLSIPFEIKPETVKLTGTVRWVAESGMGIEFF